MQGRMVEVSRIARGQLPVGDLRRSIEYYEQRLGFQVVAQMPGGKGKDERYAIKRAGLPNIGLLSTVPFKPGVFCSCRNVRVIT